MTTARRGRPGRWSARAAVAHSATIMARVRIARSDPNGRACSQLPPVQGERYHVRCDGYQLVKLEYGWAHTFEAFGICRNCARSTTFVIQESTGHDLDLFQKTSPLKVPGSLNNYFRVR